MFKSFIRMVTFGVTAGHQVTLRVRAIAISAILLEAYLLLAVKSIRMFCDVGRNWFSLSPWATTWQIHGSLLFIHLHECSWPRASSVEFTERMYLLSRWQLRSEETGYQPEGCRFVLVVTDSPKTFLLSNILIWSSNNYWWMVLVNWGLLFGSTIFLFFYMNR